MTNWDATLEIGVAEARLIEQLINYYNHHAKPVEDNIYPFDEMIEAFLARAERFLDDNDL